MRVLIVDDDIATIDMIKEEIQWEELGVEEVFTAYNIKMAKKILLNEQIDIIISDIEMPMGTGIELLSWYREQELNGEFLLLTCHESFSYASDAVRLHAAGYLLKPFDVVVMEAALKKIILKITEENQVKENSKYGTWMKKNKRQLQLDFWNKLFSGHLTDSEEKIKEEIENRGLTLETEGTYRLVTSRITNVEKDKEKIQQNLITFMIENIHSEILCGSPENSMVLCYDRKDFFSVVSVCTDTNEKELQERCKKLIVRFKDIFESDITCCISGQCSLKECYDVFCRGLELINTNVAFYGSSFLEAQGVDVQVPVTDIFDHEKLEQFLIKRDKRGYLRAVKGRMDEQMRNKTINEQVLRQTRQEILQTVYIFFGKREIQATGLMDETLDKMAEKAVQSVTDTIRWTSFLLDRVFEHEEQILGAYSIEEKINRYVREHYMENLSRNQIAAEFYLTPEYLSKMYKKQTGKSLKDYINEYRIEQAKILLEKGERVSEVAEAVGFENFTYFSTVFKQYAGVSPAAYRKR